MNLSKKFWFRLQDNICPIIFLFILQIWITISFPGYSFLGTVANAIARPIFGIIGMIGLIWLFTSSDRIEDGFIFNCAPELDEPLRRYIRNLSTVVFLLTFIVGIYYIYSKGFFKYSQSHYIIMCIYTFFLYSFLYWAIQKRKKERQC